MEKMEGNSENYKIVSIKETIPIDSQCIDSNIKNNILKQLKKIKEQTCSKKYGFINHIFEDFTIIDSEISMADSSNLFTIEYNAKTFKPMVGHKYTSNKTLFSQDTRILMDVENLFQTLIINGIVDNNFYVFETCNCKINIDPNVVQQISNLLLRAVEFKDGKYVTIGEHVH